VELHAAEHRQLDIGDAGRVEDYITNVKPDLVINAAAYTAVDRAESHATAATRVNEIGARNLASAACSMPGTRIIHISTDFVFDGRACSPYSPTSKPAPLSVYGTSKLAGELAVLSTLERRAIVVRTAWVYAARGQNFLSTMLRLMAERGEVRVVADQIGTPTAARSLARAIWSLSRESELSGVFHWTDAGVASWYDFAVAIAEEAATANLLHRAVVVKPITTAEYPTPARRPSYSVLDTRATVAALGLEPLHWRAELRSVIGELAVA
jgi:dTDP-4-dehydrorhamnose reductase